jgi:hypothetical protein
MRVETTRSFRHTWDAQAAYFAALRTVYPDAGARLDTLAVRLVQHVVPSLEANPHMGRLCRIASGVAGEAVEHAANDLFALLLPGMTRAQIVLREYVDKQFTLLYAVTPEVVYLLDLKHHKQLAYSR